VDSVSADPRFPLNEYFAQSHSSKSLSHFSIGIDAAMEQEKPGPFLNTRLIDVERGNEAIAT
jgi:hypothetical protein